MKRLSGIQDHDRKTKQRKYNQKFLCMAQNLSEVRPFLLHLAPKNLHKKMRAKSQPILVTYELQPVLINKNSKVTLILRYFLKFSLEI